MDGGVGNNKRKVVTEGYDSDSSAGSDDGFGVGGGRKGAGKSGDDKTGGDGVGDDLDDMFGEGEAGGAGDDAKGKGKAKAKEKEFLEMGDIEGQEFGKGDDGEGEDDDPDEEEEDYDLVDDLANADDAPRSRRSKKGMGYQLRCVA